MRQWTSRIVGVVALCCLQAVMLSPVLIADDPCPQESATKDVCKWSQGCDLAIVTCAGCDPYACAYGQCGYNAIQTNKFSKVSNPGWSAPPVEDGNGNALTTDCVKWWYCDVDFQGVCSPTIFPAAPCPAPYYQSVQCAGGGTPTGKQ